jgi:hypothetical protein
MLNGPRDYRPPGKPLGPFPSQWVITRLTETPKSAQDSLLLGRFLSVIACLRHMSLRCIIPVAPFVASILEKVEIPKMKSATPFSTLRRYPRNLWAKCLYYFRSHLHMVGSQEKRQELVGPAHLWRMKRDFQLNFLKAQGLQPHHVLLDFGCGVLRGGLPLIKYLDCRHYYGVEVRRSVLAEGRKALVEAGLAHKEPILLAALIPEVRFDFVWTFSVVIHMSDKILDDSMKWIAGHLEPKGRFYANVLTGSDEDGKWQGFPVVHRSLNFYRTIANRHGMQMKELGTLASLGHISGSRAQDNQIMLEFWLEDGIRA